MDSLLAAIVVANLVVTIALAGLVISSRNRGGGVDTGALEKALRSELRATGTELRQDLSAQRSELAEHLKRERDERQGAHRELRQDVETLRQGNETKLEAMRTTVDEKLQGTLVTSLAQNADRIEALTKANAEKHLELQKVLREELEKLRLGNEAKLEKMRETVDEKLQGTLEKRLGESFNLVSARLEEVQKGLGEMQNLASDVGGLKRVLTNVKSRGGWGEVQLHRQLEDLLTPEQYEVNVAIKPNTGERVEFAVKLPGRDENGAPVFLPLDSKLPQEDYERLLDAQERGDKAEIEDAGKALERAIVEQAKTIAKKYIEPPHTTDFAIMYLPTEGLFAEVVRRPGLASKLYSDHRVSIAGPTTLASLLNSLQMGFRTLAIEKRSSEVWQVLAAAKEEFRKYGEVWSKLEKQLATAQNTVSEAGRRTRAVERKLRGVESPVGAPALEDILGDADELELPEHVAAEFAALAATGVERPELLEGIETNSAAKDKTA
jgi:DNA recombination protein RmuC